MADSNGNNPGDPGYDPSQDTSVGRNPDGSIANPNAAPNPYAPNPAVVNTAPTPTPTPDPNAAGGAPDPNGRRKVVGIPVGPDPAAPAPTPAAPPPTPGGSDTPPPAGNPDISGLAGNAGDQQLVNLLMQRAQQSLNIDPNTDPIIAPQVADYGATQTRAARQAIDQQAEAGSPYATGALQNVATQMQENAGQNTANLQSTLVNNELTARRNDIQNAMSTAGTTLTAEQQLSLQQELGTIQAALSQQQINSGNDQFLATLGLNTNNQNNYWNANYNGTI